MSFGRLSMASSNGKGAVNSGSGSGPQADSFPQLAATKPNAPGQAWIEERTRIAVGRGTNISGRLIFQEPVRIEGRFRGEVSSSDLVVISEEAAVEGRIRTRRVLILGEFSGEILEAVSVVLGPRARVKANLDTEGLTVCEGAKLEGQIRAGIATRES
jgi:cytoskeletal protein CcmA (bactofilin family)